MLNNILKTYKVKHWVKNLVVFVPLIFSLNFVHLNLVFKTFMTFIAFCFISSAVYVFNDLIDIKKDKEHPIKKQRPIASGKIKFPFACFLCVFAFFTAVILSFSINKLTLFCILTYFLLNIFYSIKLKNIAIVDVSCIALGFILRILSGCAAISVIPSPLVILLTFFMSLFFSFIKRKLELKLLNKNETCRKSLKEFDFEVVNNFILIASVLSISFYFTYVLDIYTIEKTGCEFLYISAIPFTLMILRILLLVNLTKDDDPISVFKDWTLKWFIVSYFAVLFIVLNIK